MLIWRFLLHSSSCFFFWVKLTPIPTLVLGGQQVKCSWGKEGGGGGGDGHGQGDGHVQQEHHPHQVLDGQKSDFQL